jgi:hypothetical protein
MDDTTLPTLSQRLSFLGESPWAWALFLAAVVLWLFLWGRVINFLGIEDAVA